MYLTKYSPNRALDTFFGHDFLPGLRSWFENEGEQGAFRLPVTNIHETDEAYVLTMEMPGVEKNNVSVELDGDQLVVSGEKSEKVEAKGLLRREIRSEKFRRSFQIGDSVDREHIKAKLEHGVLKLTLPKRPERVGRRVEVQ